MIACGPVSEIAAHAGLPLAQRDDAAAVLMCRVVEHDAGRELSRLEGGGAEFWVPLLDAPIGAERRVRIPAREVILASKPPDFISLHNIVPGTVRRIANDSTRRSVLVEIALPSGSLVSRVTSDAIVRLDPRRASRVGIDQVHLDGGIGRVGRRHHVVRTLPRTRRAAMANASTRPFNTPAIAHITATAKAAVSMP